MTAPVVLVHGFGTSFDLTWVHNGWVDILGDTGREVIGVDLLGHGTAPKPTAPSEYADLTARVVDAISSAGVDGPVDGIGFSLGARTLLELAADRAGTFRSLVVAGVGANLFRADDHSAVVAAISSGDPSHNPTLRYFADLAELPGNDRAALAACMGCPRDPLTRDRLASIDLDVLVVLGSDDFAGPAEPLVDALPRATHVELARTDHARTPKSFEFIDAALAFLDDQDRSA